MEFLTILWDSKKQTNTDPESEPTYNSPAFDVTEHETLREAVMYLIKNGAKYEQQEIVKKVDWLPNGSQPQESQEKPKNDDPEPPSGVVNQPPDQPQTLDFSKQQTSPQKKRSIFDGHLPPNLIQMVTSGD